MKVRLLIMPFRCEFGFWMMIHSKGNVYSDSSQIQGKSKFVIIMFLSYFNIEPAQDILVRIVSAMSE